MYNVMMWYIVGLGNPGEKYARSRHNVGWLALAHVLQAWNFPDLVQDTKLDGRVTEGVFGGASVRVLYPDTFMNRSGVAVAKLVPRDAVSQLIVVHDDIALPFGVVRIAVGRGAGGNNGVASIISTLGTKEFIRIRIGIAPKSLISGEIKRPPGGGPLERFVLKPFGVLERTKLPAMYERTQAALEMIMREGVERAMNHFN